MGLLSPATGIIRCEDNLNTDIEFRLFSNSSELKFPTQKIKMKKGEKEVQFPIAINGDNSVNDGDRTCHVYADVYSTSCNCSLGSKARLTADITIIDDDGPALTVASQGTAVLEGSKGNIFTIKANNIPSRDLTLHISSDRDDLLVYDHQVTMPMGTDSVTFLVDVNTNSETDDDAIATMKVETQGYAMGTCLVLITDQNLPDASIRLTTENATVAAEEALTLRMMIKNSGDAILRKGTPIAIQLWENDKKMKEAMAELDRSIVEGDSITMEYNYAVPALVGDFVLKVVINPNKSVRELLYTNNYSNEINLTINSPLILTAQVDKEIYQPGEEVIITGEAQGVNGRNADIKVYLVNHQGELEEEIMSKTDNEGHYTVAWQPRSKQVGHYSVGACYPSEKATKEMDAFDITGLKWKISKIYHNLLVSQTDTVRFNIQNPMSIAQTGLNVSVDNQPDHYEITSSCPQQLNAGEDIDIELYLTGKSATKGSWDETLPVKITSAEGTQVSISPIYYYISPQKPQLASAVKDITTTMTMGKPREYPIVIRNTGSVPTGAIALSGPAWMSPKNIASIDPEDSITLVMKFTPDETMPLNKAIQGKFSLNPTDGSSLTIPYKITPVSTEEGSLTIDVVDELTFYGTDWMEDPNLTMARTAASNDAPHVIDAKVKVINPGTREVVAEGTTDYRGLFTADLLGGFYEVKVEAVGHKTSTLTMEVPPGMDINEEVMLWSEDFLESSWDVTETEVEDEYTAETTLKYDVRVPAPVIIITLPDTRPQVGTIFPITISNKGYINANEVDLSMEVSKGYDIEFESDTYHDVLGPNQSYVVYAKLTEASEAAKAKRADNKEEEDKDCFELKAFAKCKVNCFKYFKDLLFSIFKKFGKKACASQPSSPSGKDNNSTPKPQSHNSGGGGSVGGGGYSSPSSSTRSCIFKKKKKTPIEKVDCDDNGKIKVEYHLVMPKGDYENDQIKGVAADGVSKAVIKPNLKFPKDCDCEGGESHEWTLSENLGELTGKGWKAVYTAPDSLPGNEKKHTVKAIHKWKWCDQEGKQEITIEIRRPPLLLLHGLKDSKKCWKQFEKYVVREGLYDKEQVNNDGYAKKSNDHFKSNQGVAAKKIEKLLNTYRKKYKLNAQKVDIVGHSMGGILARLHVEYVNQNNVHKIITVNTPHSGSQLGDIMMWHPTFWSTAKFVGFNPLDAVCDLGTQSSEIGYYLNNPEALSKMEGISVHAITTQFEFGWDDAMAIRDVLGKIALVAGAIGPIGDLLVMGAGAIAVKNIADGVKDMKLDDLNWLKKSDLVVPIESQEGGLSGKNITAITGPHHLDSPHDKEVMSTLVKLLKKESHDEAFCLSGFQPKEIIYNKMSVPKKRAARQTSANKADLQLQAWREGNMLHAKAEGADEMSQMIVAVFDDQHSHVALGDTLMCEIPSTFSGDAFVQVLRYDADDNVMTDSTTVNIPQARTLPVAIDYEGNTVFTLGFDQDIELTCQWEDGSETMVTPDRMTSANGRVAWKDGVAFAVSEGDDELTFIYKGMRCVVPVEVFTYEPPMNNDPGDLDNEDDEDEETGETGDEEEEEDDSNSVCSTITLQFDQSMVMTRQAFRGTLTLKNNLDGVQMRDIKMTLDIRDADGKVATSREMQMEVEKLDGLTGEKELSAKWTLDGGKQGVATYLFIPTQYAAPTEPVTYSFGGTLSYTNPYTGKTMTREFTPVELEVSPSPVLDLTYFMQRDVMGDDPLTEEIEPMQPAEFALLINNAGYGDAKNVKLTAQAPKIVDNQKGLAIDFEIVSSQINGKEKHLALSESVTTDFGMINAHSQAYVQWWLQSSLLGHFTDYDVKVTHVTSHNNPDLSLIRNATIHELIHGFSHVTSEGTLRGFLVNDMPDSKHQPDHVYLTDATDEEVTTVTNMQIVNIGELEYRLTVTPSEMGWSYGSIADPTEGKCVLTSIKRVRDGKVMPADNVWQTYCTLRDNKDPIYEDRLHFVGILNGGEENYILTFETLPEKALEVESFSGVPEEGSLASTPVSQVEVIFNKPIDPATFTVDDISLACQGEKVNTDGIVITQVSDRKFALNLSSVTVNDGYYVLIIQTAGINDQEGYSGEKGKIISWVQYVDASMTVSIKIDPEVGGTVTPSSGKFGYGSIIHLEAVPAYGYLFSHWLKDDQVLSREATFDYFVNEEAEIHAVFIPQSFRVDISYDEQQGEIVNTPTGIYQYNYGTMLQLVSMPHEGYQFLHWMVNGEQASDRDTCVVTVNGATTVEALFELIPDGIDYVRQSGAIRCWPVPVVDYVYITGQFRKIHQVRVNDIQGKTCMICNDLDKDGKVNMNQLPPGMYILTVKTDNGIYHQKVTKR
jgi:pimeloyl-ACP methyl ester carboxylesterase